MYVNVSLLNIEPSLVTSIEYATYEEDNDEVVHITSENLMRSTRCKFWSEVGEWPLAYT